MHQGLLVTTRGMKKSTNQSTAHCPSFCSTSKRTSTMHIRHTALSHKRKRHVRVRGAPVCAAHVTSEGRPARGRGSRQAVLRTSASRVQDPRGCVKRSKHKEQKSGAYVLPSIVLPLKSYAGGVETVSAGGGRQERHTRMAACAESPEKRRVRADLDAGVAPFVRKKDGGDDDASDDGVLYAL